MSEIIEATEDKENDGLPGQVVIRDREVIASIERERRAQGDTSCALTAAKIITKYFARQPGADSRRTA